MPVLMSGQISVSTTLRMSMPRGMPWLFMLGMTLSLDAPTVISSISRVMSCATSVDSAPKRCTIAGFAAMEHPPRPTVSVMAESPRSGLASASE